MIYVDDISIAQAARGFGRLGFFIFPRADVGKLVGGRVFCQGGKTKLKASTAGCPCIVINNRDNFLIRKGRACQISAVVRRPSENIALVISGFDG